MRTWRFDVDTLRDLNRRGALYNANDPDLGRFRAAGGKLILWLGAADPAAGVVGLPDYYQRLQNLMGGLDATPTFARLFVLPGVYHCGGGYIAYQANMLGSIVSWVEEGHVPGSIAVAAALPDGSVRRRQVYAYPVEARYKGSGDINAAASFEPRSRPGPPGPVPGALSDANWKN